MRKEFKIFRRESVEGDPRVRWHHISTRTATSRTDALKRFFGPGLDVKTGETVPDGIGGEAVAPCDGWYSNDGLVFIPKRANSVPDWNGIPVLAWESGTVDFDHYNFLGTFVPAI